MDENKNVIKTTETIADRIRYLMSSRRMSQAAFGRVLGVDAAYVSKVLSGRLSLTEGFINKIVVDMGVSKQWLKYGTDTPYSKPRHMTTVDTRVTIADTPPAAGKGIAVYDIDVTAGSMELSRMLTEDRIMGYVDMPQINNDCLIVRVSGDSMKPAIANGSFIAIRPVGVSGVIFWGQIYVVVTDNYRMVKYLRRHDNPDYVILHSDNPDYDDIEMPRSEIQGLYLVETVISYDRRC